jgi:hypothetical protein
MCYLRYGPKKNPAFLILNDEIATALRTSQ